MFVFRSYGSTEHPSITGSRPSAAGGQAAVHRRRRPARRRDQARAEDGEIFSRGPDLCLGYTDDELTASAFDDDGWYRTGDVGVLDDDGYLTITDRKADVIIRGGENISALEVEEVLLAMPEVAEAVVVAAPDARLGEHAAAVLRIRAGQPMPTLDEVRGHFERAGVAGRSGRRSCTRSTTSRAPPAARSRSIGSGSPSRAQPRPTAAAKAQ